MSASIVAVLGLVLIVVEAGAFMQKGAEAKPPLKFTWPTVGRKIVQGYGERTNASGTVTVNPGIDIASKAGASVTASETGTVTAVSWLPGFGTIVIVQHRGGYRTVYGKLAAASVARGRSVKAGQMVGRAAGSVVHFQVWRGPTRLNPLTVLR